MSAIPVTIVSRTLPPVPTSFSFGASFEFIWYRINSLHALSTSRLLPDVWAIEAGTMHLNVGKTTYEGLGVNGAKVHEVFKGKGVEEQYRAFLSWMHIGSLFVVSFHGVFPKPVALWVGGRKLTLSRHRYHRPSPSVDRRG